MSEEVTNRKIFWDENSWCFTYKTIDYSALQIKYETAKGYLSKEEAISACKTKEKKYEDDVTKLKKMTDVRFTFTEYLDYWYRNVFMSYAGTSKTGFAWTIYKIIFPCLKRDVLLKNVDSIFINEILEKCKSMCTSAAPMAKKVMSIAMKDAVTDGYLTKDPIKDAASYPWQIPKVTILNKKQLSALMAEAKKYQSVYFEILLATFCGLRSGEIRGLRYTDFNIEEKTLRISRQYGRENEVTLKDDGNYVINRIEHYIKPLKTTNSYRTLRVPDVIIDEFKKRKEYNVKILHRYPDMKKIAENYVCLGPKGNIKSDSTIRSALERITNRAGIAEHVTVHGLRHIFCTILIEQGVPISKISKLMGHSSESTTFDLYCGIMDAKEELQKIVGDYFDPIYYIKEIS